MKVVDASVVLGWLLGEPAPSGGAAVIEGHVTGRDPLAAPELLHYEVANVLVTGARLPSDLARQAYANFTALEIETYSLGAPEYDAAIALAAQRRVSVYDAAYAVLALALRCRLATADRRLARALAPLGIVAVV
ncbi:MAG: type II toxin-antitoxin system VapC family toxin [Gemmatimonadetes bacterium]|nr:type II toxin-antitoxin system VapC family toxin [Gemmatimonadota bacterium]